MVWPILQEVLPVIVIAFLAHLAIKAFLATDQSSLAPELHSQEAQQFASLFVISGRGDDGHVSDLYAPVWSQDRFPSSDGFFIFGVAQCQTIFI